MNTHMRNPETLKYKLMSYKSAAESMNDRVFTDYYIRLMLIARSLFKWEGLPEGMDERWIEKYLFTEGACIFLKDPNLGFAIAKLGLDGPLNEYDDPTDLRPIFYNYVYAGPQLVNDENAVIIRNNDDMVPTAPTIQLYALKIANIDRTIDVNVHQQKTPVIIRCSERQKLSLKQVIVKRNDNEHVIFGDKNLDLSGIEVLNTQAPIVFDKLEIQKHMVYNECMTFLGVNNANMDKRERVVTGEVSANDQQVQANEDVALKARERAAERINEIFGLNISVHRRTPLNAVLGDLDIHEDDLEDIVIKNKEEK